MGEDRLANGEQPRFALLVGVSRYEHLREQLDGCTNDVQAMKEMLQSRFGFLESDIVTLLDDQATGNAIREQWRILQERVSASAKAGRQPFVLFHFSGHGSQVLDQAQGDPDCDELDGLDETLVPYDAVKQGGDQDLRDDEVYAFVDAICRNQQAKLWLVLDCCHSGTGARGTTKIRQLHRGHLQPVVPDGQRNVESRRLPPGSVFLSACRASEVEPEFQENGKTYGLMTRFLVELLNKEPKVSRMTYDLLRESIVTRYRSHRSVAQAPTPTLEYGDAGILQESIVDGVGLDRRPLWPVDNIDGDRTKALMKAGTLHGVTPGSLFEIYESPDRVLWDAPAQAPQNGESLGWLIVEKVDGSTATCRAFTWDGDKRTETDLPADFRRGFAVERYHDNGDEALRVRVVQAISPSVDRPLKETSADAPAVVRHAFQAAVKPDESPWLKWVDEDSACDVVLRIDGQYAAVFPATGVASAPSTALDERDRLVPATLVGGWGPLDLHNPEQAVTQLQDLLRRITRARNLIAIASRQQAASTSLAGAQNRVQAAIELLRVEEVDEQFMVTKSHRWKTASTAGKTTGQYLMRDGDEFAFRVVNQETSGKPIFVTVLHVDSNMGIDQIHPWQAEAGAVAEGEQKLEAGASLLVPGYFVCNGDDEAPVYGPRWAIVLATREPNQFHLLAQQGLPVTRDASKSPLESLLLEQVEFRTRGGFSRRRKPIQYDTSWGAASVQWLVTP
ncbi:caspase family protein [Lignipirellula cremea]|uniref:caspase family protein n=1 Tax=Lignipirellula cremea TaxID=2528010 RepID=UPI0018D25496|nr:caspase family protein [Lignipirellula cremea]